MLYLTQRLEIPAAATASVTLPIDVRVKSRVKVTLNDGREAGLLLPRGLLLRGGDVLSNEEGTEFVQVIAADEGVSVVRCDDPFMLAKACYHLGNRHVPLQIMPGELRYHHDHVLDDMLRQFGLTVTFGQLPFEPEAGAYASESHGHHHAHHDHHAGQQQPAGRGLQLVPGAGVGCGSRLGAGRRGLRALAATPDDGRLFYR